MIVRVHVPPADTVAVPRDVVPSRTSTVLLASAVPERTTVAVFCSALSAGDVIAGAAGAVVSTKTERLAGVLSRLPARSTARTSIVCAPADSVGAYGDVQDANAAPSMLHSKRAPLGS